MWLLGMIIGGILGASVGGVAGFLPGALLGAVFGLLIDNKRGEDTKSLSQRVMALELEVAELKERLAEHMGVPALPLDEEPVPPIENTASTPAEEPLPAELAAEMEIEPETRSPSPNAETDHEPLLEPSFPSSHPVEAPSQLWNWLFGGNILAKLGVVLLFFAVGSALKLMAEYGLLPIQMRLLLAAVGGIALIVFGHAKASEPERRMFGFAMQGGGFGILYLIVYFMLARYQFIGHTPAFGLFAALGVTCISLAASQNAASLAVLGISGAFLAPVMAAGDEGNHVALFSYFALLNTFILWVNWSKAWRSLNVAGFAFTFVIGLEWASLSYRPEFYGTTQFFLLLFFLMYTLVPTAYALLKAPGTQGWLEGAVLYGVPLVTAALQRRLLEGNDIALAWWSLGASVYYLGLWWLVRRRHDERLSIMENSYLGIALVFLTLAVPLAFDVQLTVALWALEGAAALWLDALQDRWLLRLGGAALQVYAGFYLLAHGHRSSVDVPVLNASYISALLVAATGLFSARQLRRPALTPYATLMLIWGLLWWMGASWNEIDWGMGEPHKHAAWLLLCAATGLSAESWGKREGWIQLRLAALIQDAGIFFIALFALMENGHVLHDTLTLVFPLAVFSYYRVLRRQEEDGQDWLLMLRHLAAYWLLIGLIGRELAHVASHLAPGNTLWPLLAWEMALAAGLLLPNLASSSKRWPFSSAIADYQGLGSAPVAFFTGVWTVHACLSHAGGGSGLPYLPGLSFFDLALFSGMASLLQWGRNLTRGDRNETAAYALAGISGFIWVSSLAARLVHHWGGVPFTLDDMLSSANFQQTLSFIWTLLAITLMLTATRKVMRTLWFCGFGLLVTVCLKLLMIDMANRGTVTWTLSLLGIALLTILASYFSPIPPKESEVDHS